MHSGDDNEGVACKMAMHWHGGPIKQSAVACMEEAEMGWNWLHTVQRRPKRETARIGAGSGNRGGGGNSEGNFVALCVHANNKIKRRPERETAQVGGAPKTFHSTPVPSW